jgi:hypothetical protein
MQIIDALRKAQIGLVLRSIGVAPRNPRVTADQIRSMLDAAEIQKLPTIRRGPEQIWDHTDPDFGDWEMMLDYDPLP